MESFDLSRRVIGGAIEVHRELGPGLLESVYSDALEMELKSLVLKVSRQVEVPVRYKGRELSRKLKLDMLVEETLILELKAVEAMAPVHKAQLLSYLRLSGKPLGLLINFNVPRLTQGLTRLANTRGQAK